MACDEGMAIVSIRYLKIISVFCFLLVGGTACAPGSSHSNKSHSSSDSESGWMEMEIYLPGDSGGSYAVAGENYETKHSIGGVREMTEQSSRNGIYNNF